ncbi:mammalian cell entry protein [Mycobacterium vulneris]|uniref:Virulence factor Mce family protein n=2 Tax=Mycolicibacterium septicum TaxID=98668 RepID=A0A7X6RZR9_9MYCO|nr:MULTISPECIES: virulence factor Mce family protein [Mycolicibacterium]MBX8690358.1 MCE family protein [Mycobacterium sp. 20091114027_K0903767]OCB47894.1 mammalian cell entry protein [Mycolicibacterium vulneris]NKZ14916.1 virulence factor Mce family protein [Mycolicibacterium septicum DSM 44393]OBK07212.1 mammalian cell entry protein [Mycolicibacterium fortuitum]OBK65708.1 mammalian cell entry protein [Mycolicibacterium fortuitum]
MKPFSERNPVTLGLIGALVLTAIIVAALQFKNLPFVSSGNVYSAYFADAGGLKTGAEVQVAGFQVGEVRSITLEDSHALVTFDVSDDVHVGDRSEAAIKTKALLGSKTLEVTPRGDEEQRDTIPVERTTSPYQLPDALGDLSATISGLNTDQLSNSLTTLAQTFANTPPQLQAAVQGVARFSQTLAERDADLRSLLTNANKATGILAERSDQIVSLVKNTNALLAELRNQSAALDELSANFTALSQQLRGLIADNRSTLKPALDRLNGVLAIIDNRKARLQEAFVGLSDYATALGEAVSAGPFFKAYLSNLLPGQFVQPFVDAAFSDLGLDPSVLLPSQRVDPEVGQPATPPLPVPYPRTGQGGEPNLTLPDAITGNPGDPGCGPPGVPLPGPTGCYPYREPLPAPPPGGPPPGPPAVVPAAPTPTPVLVPAPGEAAPGSEPGPAPTEGEQ